MNSCNSLLVRDHWAMRRDWHWYYSHRHVRIFQLSHQELSSARIQSIPCKSQTQLNYNTSTYNTNNAIYNKVTQWAVIGNFTAPNSRELHYYQLPELAWFKYVTNIKQIVLNQLYPTGILRSKCWHTTAMSSTVQSHKSKCTVKHSSNSSNKSSRTIRTETKRSVSPLRATSHLMEEILKPIRVTMVRRTFW